MPVPRLQHAEAVRPHHTRGPRPRDAALLPSSGRADGSGLRAVSPELGSARHRGRRPGSRRPAASGPWPCCGMLTARAPLLSPRQLRRVLGSALSPVAAVTSALRPSVCSGRSRCSGSCGGCWATAKGSRGRLRVQGPRPGRAPLPPAPRAMAAAPRGWAGGSRWTWRPVARDALLARAFHSCTELRGRLYLVGGLLAGGATEPSADTVVLDPAGDQAVRLGARGGPRRSHHDAVPLGGRWLCAVGGWDGSRRLATVAALDTERGEWEAWAAAPGSCPPAGLSSHTCTRLSDREVRVAGREGGTRTQRRFGSIYTLRLDPGARTYWYGTPAPNRPPSLHLHSRRAGRGSTVSQAFYPHPQPSTLLPGMHRVQGSRTLRNPPCPPTHATVPCLLFSPWPKGWGKGNSTYVSQKTPLRPDCVRVPSYKEEGDHTASRSGHCAALLRGPGPRPAHQLLLFGGCSSAEPEVAGHWSPGTIKVLPTHTLLRVQGG